MSEHAQNIARAMRRSIDDLIIAAVIGDAASTIDTRLHPDCPRCRNPVSRSERRACGHGESEFDVWCSNCGLIHDGAIRGWDEITDRWFSKLWFTSKEKAG